MENSKSKFETKDFILIGILSSVFFAIYMALGVITAMAGPVIHVFTPAIGGVICGTIYLLLISKCPKIGIFTISSLVTMVLFQLIGSTYLPWVIAVMLASVLADIICIPTKYKNFKMISISYGIIMVGHVLGNIFPILFFVDKFRDTFLSKGADISFLDKMINFLQGPISFVIILIVFISGLVGMLLAKKLLNKHFRKAGIA